MPDLSDWNSQVRRGVLELCILALIDREPQYGYEIVTQLAAVPQLAAGEGTIYPLLRRLKKDGWMDTFWQESVAGPPRQYYRLTPDGAAALAAMRHEWSQLAASVEKYLARGSVVDG
ncbi:MAG TPA: PadR family transcriptional regulator [Symbiobacteriaceae bacterium]|nr:PadR family transcriptional regulator [Symbiobacteriaceae bacterium]